MHNVSSSYFDAASLLTVALLAASFLVFWLAWGHGLAGVVWPVFELHDEQLALGISFQKSTTFKPTALLPASR